MIESMSDGSARMSRAAFLKRAAFLTAGATLGLRSQAEGNEEEMELPFENGRRPLVVYPQKRPLLRLTTRPPQLETPFAVFDQSPLTPNDAFFVRYHLTQSPPPAEVLSPEAFRVSLRGRVRTPQEWAVDDLKRQFESIEIVAVNQCSGNSRGFFQPRVSGGQLGNGAMGNARWKGVRLRDVLRKAGLEADAQQVVFDGLDKSLLPQTPDFVKALNVDHALSEDVLLAYEMNGEPLPWLNGYPLRLVVPGYYGTYWVKHLSSMTVVDKAFTGYWMSTAYRIPDNDCACVPPGTKPEKTIPIHRMNVRSFLTNIEEGRSLKSGQSTLLRGIAFDGGTGIREVHISADDGKTWQPATLGKDLGKYSFREWTASWIPPVAGRYALRVRATNQEGQTQPNEPRWNPAGYMRNVIETVHVSAT